MHIPKLLLVTAFLAAVGASSLHAQRPDSDTQSKARAALEAAPAEPAPSNTAPPAPTVMPEPAPAPKPPVAPVPVAPPPAAPAPTMAQAQAPQVAPPPAQPAAPASAEKSQQLLKPVPVAATPSHVSAMSPLAVSGAAPASTLTPEQAERAREALRNPAGVATTPMAPSAQANPNGAAPQMPSAADSQEARLAELLLLYKNDQITPTEYQARRAKILSGQ